LTVKSESAVVSHKKIFMPPIVQEWENI